MDSYPTSEDILFEIESFLAKKEKLDCCFSFSDARKISQAKITDDEFGEKMNELETSGFVASEEKNNKKYFRILKNPFV